MALSLSPKDTSDVNVAPPSFNRTLSIVTPAAAVVSLIVSIVSVPDTSRLLEIVALPSILSIASLIFVRTDDRLSPLLSDPSSHIPLVGSV